MNYPTLASKRAEINARYAEVKSWRKVARDYYPMVKPGTLCAVAKGYEPKRAKVLTALGLPLLRPAPVCECGEVHLSKRCPNKPRPPAKPRIAYKPIAKSMTWAALLLLAQKR